MVFKHESVLREELVEMTFGPDNGIYVDCTLGGAGHFSRLLEKLGPEGKLVGFDQDEKAIINAENNFGSNTKIELINKNFIEIKETLVELKLFPVNGIMFDLGVSSPQLDEAERGFSYMQDAPLDMRMNSKADLNAKYIVNYWSEEKIASTIKEYGEEKWAVRIAKFIVEYRERKQLETTGDLVAVIKAAVPAGARRDGPHPAKRTFQALRIAVNDELGVLKNA
ncbi:MAG: 16S rRNA (cytosine(1402)-N(4))-methyltransferase RsmH, partial [Eubacteriales bacterium]